MVQHLVTHTHRSGRLHRYGYTAVHPGDVPPVSEATTMPTIDVVHLVRTSCGSITDFPRLRAPPGCAVTLVVGTRASVVLLLLLLLLRHRHRPLLACASTASGASGPATIHHLSPPVAPAPPPPPLPLPLPLLLPVPSAPPHGLQPQHPHGHRHCCQ